MAIERAAEAVDETHYRGINGDAVRQTTAAAAVQRHVGLLNVNPGDRVLEIGTGSGYSTALLAELAGPSGHITSIDLEPGLAERAANLHEKAGRHNITSVTANGARGYAADAPYDRLVAWTTPPSIPHTWVSQLRPGGTLLAPARIADLIYATVMLRATVNQAPLARTRVATAGLHRSLDDLSVHRGAYVIMDTPDQEHFEADTADARSRRPGDDYDSYVCAEWLHDDPARAHNILHMLLTAGHSEPTEIGWPDSEHLKTWLIAVSPPGLVATGISRDIGIGITDGSHIAVLSVLPGEILRADSPTSPALTRLRHLIQQWETNGRPPIDHLTPHAQHTATGWRLTVNPAKPIR